MKMLRPLPACLAILLATSPFGFAQSAPAPATEAPTIPSPAPANPVSARPATPADPSAGVPGEDVPKPMEYNSAPLIRVDVLMVSLSEDKALPLLPALREPAQVQATQTRLLEMIGRKEATLEAWPEVTMHSGLRSVCESITEQRYPIEYEDPTAAITPGGKTDGELTPAQKALSYLRNSGLAAPTTFETRNTGATLEVEAVVSPDGSSVGLRFAPQLVRLESMRPFDAGVSDKGTKMTIEQPIFSTAKVNTSLSLRDGERRLIYAGKSGEVRGRMDLFIVGVKIFPAPATKR
jgi:hypothetical protein